LITRSYVPTQCLHDNAEQLKKHDAQLRTSNDIFGRELEHLSTANELLTKTVGDLQQKVTDMNDNIRCVRQQVRQPGLLKWTLKALGSFTNENLKTSKSEF